MTRIAFCKPCGKRRRHYERLCGDIATLEEHRELVCSVCGNVSSTEQTLAPVLRVGVPERNLVTDLLRREQVKSGTRSIFAAAFERRKRITVREGRERILASVYRRLEDVSSGRISNHRDPRDLVTDVARKGVVVHGAFGTDRSPR